MADFSLVAMGGTFDIIHRGHLTLLSHAFLKSDKVIIGLASDAFAKKNGKTLQNNFKARFTTLIKTVLLKFPKSNFQISKLEDDFGPAVFQKDVEALVVSSETSAQGEKLNELRVQKYLPAVEIITVPMYLAADGTRISTTRIRKFEIDIEGNLL